MKRSISSVVVSILLSQSFPLYAQSCPFNDPTLRPSWIDEMKSDSEVFAIGAAVYDSKLHHTIFDLRKSSEQSAKEAVSFQLESTVVNELLTSKSFQNGALVTHAEKITSQVTEYSLPDVTVSDRWLDSSNCVLWTRVSVGKKVIEEYIDEVSNLERNVEDMVDKNLTLSVKEELNKQQFYLNYQGFTKALQSSASIAIGNQTKTALAWMIQEGFNPFEPAYGQGMVWTSSFQMNFNTSPIISYMTMESVTSEQMSYILESYKQLNIDVNTLHTPAIKIQLQALDTANYSDSYAFILGSFGQRNDSTLAYKLGIRIAEEQEPNRLKVLKKYDQQSLYPIGGWNMLHLANFAKRVDLVKVLLDKGMDPNVTDASGMSAAQYAIGMENKALIELYLNEKKQLEGIYSIATRKMLNNVLFQMVMRNNDVGKDSAIIESIKKIKMKNEGSTLQASNVLGDDIKRLEKYFKMAKHPELDEAGQRDVLKMLEKLM